jgi:uncharacterized protein (TIGR03546 family)
MPREMTMLTMIAKLLKILNSESEPTQISLALGFSMVSGFLPFIGPLNLMVLLIVFLLRVNLSAYFLGAAFFSGLSYFLDPLFHIVGLSVLTSVVLEGLWTSLYNSTIWRIQRFNNSVVMGGIVCAVLCLVPMVLVVNMLIRKYRDHVLIWVKKTRVMQLFFASKLYSIYVKISE